MKKKNKRRQQYYYWDLVKGRDVYEQRISITLFSCLKLQYVSYTKGISARHYDLETDDDIWKSLPNTVLLNIFCKSELKDRLQSIPLVCKSWKYVTDDPRCWSSMIPDSVSPEHAFIKKKTRHPFKRYRLVSKYHGNRDYNYLDYHQEEVSVGVSRLRTLIKKSKGGAAITTLYLSPFFPYFLDWGDNDETYNEILHLIANCCPNLKHISFDAWDQTSMKVLHRLFNSCKKLELIDFFYLRHTPLIVQLLGSCCLPNLQGIRISGYNPNKTAVSIAKYLPQLNLLSFRLGSLTSKDLSIILVSCLKLQYLHVQENGQPRLCYSGDNILRQAYSQIPVFHYDYKNPYGYWSRERYDDEYHQSADCSELTVDELNCFEDHHDYYCIDYYDNILQQRKVKKEYDYMFQF